jgi:hypothetical protein
MSKVYSFRLNENNPREAQAKEVIEAWVREGYTLRNGIVEALITNKKEIVGQSDLISVMEQIQGLFMALDEHQVTQTSETALPNTFLNALKDSVKTGLSSR